MSTKSKKSKKKQTKQDRIIELLEDILRNLPCSQPPLGGYIPQNINTYQQRCAKCGQYYTGFHQCITYYG